MGYKYIKQNQIQKHAINTDNAIKYRQSKQIQKPTTNRGKTQPNTKRQTNTEDTTK